ncbi:glycosyl transferase [Campylobacterota bacterium]|nr:glycosyl transferase [Campylobacterota bacterium]
MKICIIRLSALGDVCLFLPAFHILRRNFPRAEIVWIISPLEYELVRGLEGAEFVIYDKTSGLSGAFELGRTLLGRRFDYLLMAQESLRASALSLFVKADVRLGYDRARSKDFQRFFTNQTIAPHECAHLIENGIDFARALGATDLAIEYKLTIPDEAKAEADAITNGVRYCVISPVANQVRRNWRNWTAAGYAAVIDFVRERYGVVAVLSGAKADRVFTDEIKRLAKTEPIDAVGITTIKGLLALIKNALFVVAPDSGPGHFAAALGTPAIALIAAADPRRAAPFQRPSYTVDRYEQALKRFCGKTPSEVKFGTRVRDPLAMSEIGIEAVTEMIEKVMKERYDNIS